jgi:L-ascorbate metabolism protein UlaG (beta-lactamase superfamily)
MSIDRKTGATGKAALAALFAVLLAGAGAAYAQTPGRLAAEGGDIVITPIINSSVRIEHAGRVIYIDPWSFIDFSKAPKADLILITDDPNHHFDPKAIAQLSKPGTSVVVTAKVHEKFPAGKALANGKSGVFAGIKVEAIPTYDMTPGEPYHPKGEGNGYVVTLGGKRIYHAGVGECVPEIQALKNIDVAFLSMRGSADRMSPIAVAECAKTFKPKYLYAHHYDRPFMHFLEFPKQYPPPSEKRTLADLRALGEALKGTGITFWDAKWYPKYPPEPPAK